MSPGNGEEFLARGGGGEMRQGVRSVIYIYIYVYTYICIHIYMYTHIYVYIELNREKVHPQTRCQK